jgi:hypothetical protein
MQPVTTIGAILVYPHKRKVHRLELFVYVSLVDHGWHVVYSLIRQAIVWAALCAMCFAVSLVSSHDTPGYRERFGPIVYIDAMRAARRVALLYPSQYMKNDAANVNNPTNTYVGMFTLLSYPLQ